MGGPTEMTVGELMRALSGCDAEAPVRLAVNPFFPMAHRLEQVVTQRSWDGGAVVYLAEGCEGEEQMGPLPPEVAATLMWQAPVHAPRRERRSARRRGD
ncbi:hypothetical protein [Streptomyces albus]|uniref:hypothetical protein n=1 Tax=Streptomyces albus TaxID=1888 RepID=UPI003F1CCD0F